MKSEDASMGESEREGRSLSETIHAQGGITKGDGTGVGSRHDSNLFR
jgi:hypothetical protein